MGQSRRKSEHGQASVEHVGLVLLLALLVAGLAAVIPVSGVAGDLAAAIGGAVSSGSAGAEAEAAAPRPPETSWAESRAFVDHLLGSPLADFLAYRSSPERDPQLDYSTDLCSAPLVGSSGASFDFTEPCLRHDFGYRNYDRLGLFERRKDAVDQRFLADMRDHCYSRPAGELARCLTWARVFYEAVHRFGHLSGHGN